MTTMAHGEARSRRRLLVINPNTNPAVTAQVRKAALAAAYAGTEVEVVNPIEGPFAVETPQDRAEASRHVVSLVAARRRENFDGYVLACFDDIGVAEARRLVDVPVVSMFGASVAEARRVAGRFAVVTTVESAVPGIEALLAAYGVVDRCTVRAAGIGVAEAAARSERAERHLFAAIERAIRKDGAEAIILGSGALTGRAEELGERFALPFVDGLAAAVSSPFTELSIVT